jgi:hypothetical protein
MSDFYKYFQENMDALGLPAPESLFGTASAAVANAAAILGQIDKMGKAVTVRELVGAGTILEGAGYLGGCLAAAYVGAVIGSLAVATGRSLSGGTSLADVLFTAKRYKLDRKWLAPALRRHPAIYARKLASSTSYQLHMRAFA